VTGTIVRPRRSARHVDRRRGGRAHRLHHRDDDRRQVIPSPTSLPIPFSIAVDTGVIDPTDTYVARRASSTAASWGRPRGRARRRERKLLTGVTVAVTRAEPFGPPSATHHRLAMAPAEPVSAGGHRPAGV
jgi:hypothetical protein